MSLQLLFHCHNFCTPVRQKWCKEGRGILSKACTASVGPSVTTTTYCLAYVQVHKNKVVKDSSLLRPVVVDIKTHDGAQEWFLTSLLDCTTQTLEMWTVSAAAGFQYQYLRFLEDDTPRWQIRSATKTTRDHRECFRSSILVSLKSRVFRASESIIWFFKMRWR